MIASSTIRFPVVVVRRGKVFSPLRMADCDIKKVADAAINRRQWSCQDATIVLNVGVCDRSVNGDTKGNQLFLTSAHHHS